MNYSGISPRDEYRGIEKPRLRCEASEADSNSSQETTFIKNTYKKYKILVRRSASTVCSAES